MEIVVVGRGWKCLRMHGVPPGAARTARWLRAGHSSHFFRSFLCRKFSVLSFFQWRVPGITGKVGTSSYVFDNAT